MFEPISQPEATQPRTEASTGTPAATATGTPTPAERRAAVEKSKAYLTGDDPGHAAAVQEAYRLRQEEEVGTPRKSAADMDKDGTPEWLDDATAAQVIAALPDVDTAARHAGVDRPSLPQSIKDNWSEEAEADFYENFVVSENISGPSAEKAMQYYTDLLILGGRSETGLRPGDVEQAIEYLQSPEVRMTKAQATRLARWVERLGKDQE